MIATVSSSPQSIYSIDPITKQAKTLISSNTEYYYCGTVKNNLFSMTTSKQFSKGSDNALKRLDLKTRLLKSYPGIKIDRGTFPRISADGKLLGTLADRGLAYLWDLSQCPSMDTTIEP